MDGDGREDIVTGAGPTGGPHVRVIRVDGSTLTELASFYAYNPGFIGGARVSAGDIDGDGTAEVIVGAGPSGGPHVLALQIDASTVTEVASFYAYDPAFRGGVWVGATDVDGDGSSEIVTGAGKGGGPHVRVIRVDSSTLTETASFYATTSLYDLIVARFCTGTGQGSARHRYPADHLLEAGGSAA